ncbi:MAG: hypothetical protein KKC68_08450 [Candidatus Thermoplasmatota archaeon]|nr:hypothetical protein [Candidatus Thermoplasmatota archaeon]
MLVGMEWITQLPLWAILLGVILIIIIFWKLIKFAIKILIIILVFFLILIGLDLLGVFAWINQNILAHFL